VGSVMIPQMIKNGYPRGFAGNVTISGSLQPLLLPPSHNMIIYSIAAEWGHLALRQHTPTGPRWRSVPRS